MNVIGWILDKKWAMLPASLSALIDIVQRNASIGIDSALFHKGDYNIDSKDSSVLMLNRKEALLGSDGVLLQGTSDVILRGSVAILPVMGPIFPRSNLMTSMSGATSLQTIAADFNKALSSDDVKSIILDIDSPGGEVTDVAALGDMIYKAREVKPITAFVSGMAASAGFWIGSSASVMLSANTGEVGSIGVVAGIKDTSEKDAKEGVANINIVSSISPMKRPDYKTEDGRQGTQKIVDDLGVIFAETVARNRNVSFQDVITKFGKGDMLLAKDALSVGMIDGISSLEDVINAQNNNPQSQLKGEIVMGKKITEATAADIKAENPDVYAEIANEGKSTSAEALEKAKAEGVEAGKKAENERIKSIDGLSSNDTSAIVDEHKYDMTKTKEDVALAIVEGQNKSAKAQADAITSDAEDADKGIDTSSPDANEDEKAKRSKAAKNIAAGMNAHNKKNKKV